jgi:hypothetical protein
MNIIDGCPRHPRYKGKSKPKHECTICLQMYIALRKPRVLPMPTKVYKDKKKYNRKKKVLDE